MADSIRVNLHFVSSEQVIFLCNVKVDLVRLGALPGCKDFVRFAIALIVFYYSLL